MDKKGKFLKLTSGVVLLGSAPSLVSMAEVKDEDVLKKTLKFLVNIFGIGFVLPYIVLLVCRKAELKEIKASLEDVEKKLKEKKAAFENENIALKDLNNKSEKAQKVLAEKETSLDSLKTESKKELAELEEKHKTLISLKEQYEKEKAEVEKIEERKKNLEEELNQKKSEIDAKRKGIVDAEKEADVIRKDFDLKEKEANAETNKLTLLEQAAASFKRAVENMKQFVECNDFLNATRNLELAESDFKCHDKELKNMFSVFNIEVTDKDYDDVEKLSIKSKKLAKLAKDFARRYYRLVDYSKNIIKTKVEEKEGKYVMDLPNFKHKLKGFLGTLLELNVISVRGNSVLSLFVNELQRLMKIYNNFDEQFGGRNVNVKDKYDEICKDVKVIIDKMKKLVEGKFCISKEWDKRLGGLPEKMAECKNKANKAKECINSFNEKYSKEYTSEEIEDILCGMERSKNIKCTVLDIKNGFEEMKKIKSDCFLKETGEAHFNDYSDGPFVSDICERILDYGYNNFGLVSGFCKDFLDYYDKHEKAFLENKIKEQEEKVETLKREEEELRENLRQELYKFSLLSTTLVYDEHNKGYIEDQAAHLEQKQKDRSTLVSEKEEEINKLSEEYKNLVSEKEKKLEEQKSFEEKIKKLSEECKDFESRKQNILSNKKELEEEIKDLSEERKRVLEVHKSVKDRMDCLSKKCKDLAKNVNDLEIQKSSLDKKKHSMSDNFYSLDFFKSFDEDLEGAQN